MLVTLTKPRKASLGFATSSHTSAPSSRVYYVTLALSHSSLRAIHRTLYIHIQLYLHLWLSTALQRSPSHRSTRTFVTRALRHAIRHARCDTHISSHSIYSPLRSTTSCTPTGPLQPVHSSLRYTRYVTRHANPVTHHRHTISHCIVLPQFRLLGSVIWPQKTPRTTASCDRF